MANTGVVTQPKTAYPEIARLGAAGTGGNVDSRQTGTTTGSSNSAESQNASGAAAKNGVQNTNSTTTKNFTQSNMTPQQQAMLNQLLEQLMNGGTPEMQRQNAERAAERQTVRNQRDGYSKSDAFADSAGLIAQQSRRVLEQLLPSINRAAEDAGSSGGALRALLLQDAANKASESSSALGVKTAVDYGNIAGNFSQILERLTQTDNSGVQALIGALGIAKGATVSGTETSKTQGTTTTSETSSQVSQQNNNKVINTAENKNVNTDYAPFTVVSSAGSTTPQFFGQQDGGIDATKFIGTTLDTLSQLNGTGNPWRAYSF